MARTPVDAASARRQAHRLAGEGFGLIAQAVNACDNPAVPYRFTAPTRKRIEELARELFTIIEQGEVVGFAPGQARADGDFQAFMRHALKRPSRRRASTSNGTSA